jgi:hypothetical protein
MEIVKSLQMQESEIMARREQCRSEIRRLTKELYNTRQKIKYAKTHGSKCGALFEMFGKTLQELSPDELKMYNREMQKKRRKNI